MKKETDVIVLSTNDALTTNLEKENITDAVILDLKTKYSDLTISGLEDKKGYQAVDKARLDVKQKRIVAEKICNVFVAEAHSIHKSRTAKRAEIVSQFTEIEKQLEAKQAIIDNEVKRLAEIEVQKKKEKNAKRISDLQALNYKGDFLVIEFLSDEQFAEKLSLAKSEFDAEQSKIAEEKRLAQAETERLEQQRKDQEEEAKRLAKIKAEQEAEALRLENEQKEKIRLIEEREAKIKAEEDRIKREKIEAEQKVIRDKELEEVKKIAAEKALKEAEEKRIADEKLAIEKAQAEKKEAERLEALKSVKERLASWVNTFSIEISGDLTENETVKSIFAKHKAFKEWAQKEIDSLK